MAVIRRCHFLHLLLSLIVITASVHCIALASTEKPSEATSNPNLKADSTTPVWCVAKNNAEDSDLQTAVDWTCGQGGTDCGPIQQGGPCYYPNNLQNMASYAFNDYFLKHGTTKESCNFGNTGDLTSLDPSHGKCVFPSSSLIFNFSGTAGLAVGGWGWTLIIGPLLITSTLTFLI